MREGLAQAFAQADVLTHKVADTATCEDLCQQTPFCNAYQFLATECLIFAKRSGSATPTADSDSSGVACFVKEYNYPDKSAEGKGRTCKRVA